MLLIAFFVTIHVFVLKSDDVRAQEEVDIVQRSVL